MSPVLAGALWQVISLFSSFYSPELSDTAVYEPDMRAGSEPLRAVDFSLFCPLTICLVTGPAWFSGDPRWREPRSPLLLK